MFPDFKYLFQAIFGAPMPEWLSLFKTFGFFVALAFLGAAWATASELKRKEMQGLLKPEIKTIELGKPITMKDILVSALIGMVIGYKIGGFFTDFVTISPDPMGYIFSAKGNFLGAIIGLLIGGGSKLWEKSQRASEKHEIKTVAVYPHQLITEIVVVAAISGLLGAKIFNAFETWDDFIKDPIRSLVSSSGLTFLGGLIMSIIAFYYYSRKHKIPFKHLCDSTAPGIMLAYGIGRLGCHFSGDGDWGIYNTAYVSARDGSLHAATPNDAMAMHMIGDAPRAYVPAPDGLPRWLFGMNYPHNVGYEGMPIQGCTGEYCNVLPVSVFPTPIYEAVVCVGLFFLLWAIRKRFTRSLQMFGTYLMLVGIERFLVELIRVNYKYDWGFIHPTQAEILSVVLVIIGAGLLLFYRDKKAPLTPAT